MNKYMISLSVVVVLLTLLVGISVGYALYYEEPITCPDYNITFTCSSVEPQDCPECKLTCGSGSCPVDEVEVRERDNRSSDEGTGYRNQQSECARLHNRSLC